MNFYPNGAHVSSRKTVYMLLIAKFTRNRNISMFKTENGYQGAKQLRTYFNLKFRTFNGSKWASNWKAKSSAEKSVLFVNKSCETEIFKWKRAPYIFLKPSVGQLVWHCALHVFDFAQPNHRITFVVVNKECSKWKGTIFTAFILMRKRSMFIFHTTWISGIYWCISKS